MISRRWGDNMGDQRGIEIQTDILNKTVKCRENFSCLSGEKRCLCKVEKGIGNNNNTVLFIKPARKTICDYIISYGYSFICFCPTRKEIYRLYNT
jgi:hypothetical protein